MHVTILGMGKHKRHCFNTSQLPIVKSQHKFDWPVCKLKDGHTDAQISHDAIWVQQVEEQGHTVLLPVAP